MKHLFRYCGDYKKECIIGPLFKMLEACFELCVPLVMKRIIDIGIKNSDTGYILRMSLLLVLLGALGLSSTITAQYFSAKAAVGVVSKIKRALLVKIGALSYADADRVGVSSMITNMTSDANQVQSGINLTLRLFMRSPFVVFGAMIMAFQIDTKAALTFAVVIPLLSLVVFGIMLSCIPLYKRVQSRLDRVLGMTRGNIAGVRVIRAFCREEAETKDFDSAAEELNSEQRLVGRISALMNPLTYILINFAVLALIYIGALRVDAGILTQGAVVSLYNYMLLILTELIELANLIITMTKSVACEKRIEEVLDMEVSQTSPEKLAAEPENDLSVEFRNVALKYGSAGANSLEGITFGAKKGDVVGIIGGTGSGKSSLVNLIPRLYDATEGEVLVDGVDVKKYPLDELREKIGLVPQKALLFKGTIRSNLLWGNKDADDETLEEALVTSQSKEFVDKKEKKLDEPVLQGGKNFSGGQKQRLTIARALVRRPEILILDDSASALDFATDAALRKALRNLPYKPTVFIVSQRTSSIRTADKIIVLDDGKAVGIGTHDELLGTCEVYREIHESQYKKEDASK